MSMITSGKLYRRKRDGALYFCNAEDQTYHAQWGLSVYLRPKWAGRSHWKSVEAFKAQYEIAK